MNEFKVGDAVLSPGGFPMTVVDPPRKGARQEGVTYCRSMGGGIMPMDTERLKPLTYQPRYRYAAPPAF